MYFTIIRFTEYNLVEIRACSIIVKVLKYKLKNNNNKKQASYECKALND